MKRQNLLEKLMIATNCSCCMNLSVILDCFMNDEVLGQHWRPSRDHLQRDQ